MGLGNKLLDINYKPEQVIEKASHNIEMPFYAGKFVKCPVKFTSDVFEFMESSEFMNIELRPIQRIIIEDMYNTFDDNGLPKYNQGVVISGMRCHALGTKVLMYNGTLKNIEDIKVGDKVMGPDSKPRNVLEVCAGESELFEIRQDKGITYVVNDEHILSLKKDIKWCIRCSSKNPGRNINYSAYPDIVEIPIKEYLKKSKSWKRCFKGYKPDCIEFSAQPVPIDPYLLGLWLGDGSNDVLKITSADIEVSSWLEDFANKNDMKLSVYKKKGTVARDYKLVKKIQNSSIPNPIWMEFKKLELIKNKHIPLIYLANSKEVRLQLLAALIDTDGWYNGLNTYEITQVNETLIRGIKLIADTLGYITNLRKKETSCQVDGCKGTAWRLSIYGDVSDIPVKIQRKKFLEKPYKTSNRKAMSNLSVSSLGMGKFAGISIDGDHLYCLEDCTVTRNSGKSAVASMCCAWQTHCLLQYDSPAEALGQMSGYQLTAQFIATSEAQSKQTAYSSFETLMNANSWWTKYIAYLKDREINEGKETLYQGLTRSIFFKEKNVIIKSLHSNSASLAGMTSYFVVFDEMSRFKVSDNEIQLESEKSCAQAVYNTSSRSAASLNPFSRILTVTSPMYEKDYGMQLLYLAGTVRAWSNSQLTDTLRRKYRPKTGRHNEKMVGYHFTTFEMAPRVKNKYGIMTGVSEEDFINEQMQSPLAYSRDYLAIPPGSENPFFEHPDRIEMCVSPVSGLFQFTDKIIDDVCLVDGKTEIRSYIAKDIYIDHGDKRKRYFICCDQGEKKCKFVVCMGHIEDYTGVEGAKQPYKIKIDFVEEWTPDLYKKITVSFSNVEEIIKILAAKFNVIRVTYDQWQSVESIQRLFAQGINSVRLEINTQMYEEMKRLFYSGYVDIPQSDLLMTELRQLNLVRGTKIDKPPNGSKDAADAVCRVIYSCYGDYMESAINSEGDISKGRLVHAPNVRDVYAILKKEDEMKQSMTFSSRNTGGYDIFGSSDTYVQCNVPGGAAGRRKGGFDLHKALNGKR
jgi:hypothetical protein